MHRLTLLPQLEASDAEDDDIWFRHPYPGVKTIRVGDKLHIVVITLRLPSSKTLVPECLYSYDGLTPDNQSTKQNLNSLGCLRTIQTTLNPTAITQSISRLVIELRRRSYFNLKGE
jgi:hypothetical protein